jgi:hypothetical protein
VSSAIRSAINEACSSPRAPLIVAWTLSGASWRTISARGQYVAPAHGKRSGPSGPGLIDRGDELGRQPSLADRLRRGRRGLGCDARCRPNRMRSEAHRALVPCRRKTSPCRRAEARDLAHGKGRPRLNPPERAASIGSTGSDSTLPRRRRCVTSEQRLAGLEPPAAVASQA